MESRERVRVPEAPAIYRRIASGAPTPEIEAQILSDSAPGNDAAEKLLLGLEELLMRGDEGRLVIERLSLGEGPSAQAAKVILRDSLKSEQVGRLERVLGIKRWGERVDFYNDREVESRLQSRIDEKGYSSSTVEEILLENHIEEDVNGLSPHMDELIDKQVITEAATFGSAEPVYLELLGPRELLRLRSMPSGRFLLLGSYGKYSARDFSAYARKINPRLETHVIDINEDSIEAINENKSEGQGLARADARMLPFAPESFDHIYTNSLFHFLRTEGFFKTMRTRWDIGHVLEEVHAALKPGGSFVMQEQPYGRLRKKEDAIEIMRDDILKQAAEAGFERGVVLDRGLAYALVPEYMSATIDANGFPHYEDALILDGGEGSAPVQIRLVKGAK